MIKGPKVPAKNVFAIFNRLDYQPLLGNWTHVPWASPLRIHLNELCAFRVIISSLTFSLFSKLSARKNNYTFLTVGFFSHKIAFQGACMIIILIILLLIARKLTFEYDQMRVRFSPTQANCHIRRRRTDRRRNDRFPSLLCPVAHFVLTLTPRPLFDRSCFLTYAKIQAVLPSNK